MNPSDLVKSSFQDKPCYRYIRESDKLPTYRVVTGGNVAFMTCKVRLFNPTGIGTWWIATYNPETEIAFGIAGIHEMEVGDIYMPELVQFRGPTIPIPIERDLHFRPTTIADILRGKGN